MNGYFKVQKIENSNQIFSPTQKNISYLNNNLINNIKNGLISIGKKENINNNVEFEGMQEVPMKKENISFYSNGQKRNNFYGQNKKLNKSFNSNTIPDFSNLINSFSNKTNFNKQFSNKIYQPLETSDLFYTEENNIKQTKSNYSSLSENKYQFMNKMSANPFIEFSEKNIPKTNYNQIDPLKSSKKENLNNSMNLTYLQYNSKTYRNFPLKNILNNERENRFLNNKISSNYNYNIVNRNNYPQKIEIATVTPIAYNQIPIQNINKRILNYQISEKNNNFQIKNGTNTKNPQKSFNNYIINDSNSFNNLENQRLTVGYQNINDINKNTPLNYGNNIQQNIKNISIDFNYNTKAQEKPEIATVTKIFSLHTKSSNSSNNHQNIINNYIFNQINNSISNNSINFIENNNKKIVNNKNKIILNEKNIQINNNQLIKNSNINNKYNEIQKKNNIENKNNNNNYQIQRNIINNNQNNYNVNQNIENKLSNSIINQERNTYTYPSKLYIIKPSEKSEKVVSNYKTGTNIILSNNNDNSKNKEERKKGSKNKIKVNKLKTTKKINKKEKIKNIKKKEELNRNGIKVRYSDFDGTGYIKNYSAVTRPGKDMEGKIKINQDSLICLTNINNIKDFNIFGVLDGHGPEGHFVSEYITNYIPSKIIYDPNIQKLTDTEEIYKKLKENNCKIILQAFIDADKQLENVEFNTSESGTTCCLIIHIGNHILCANTGDSRAIVTFDESNESKKLKNLQCVPLSIDYKPDLPEEANRIIMSGGEIEQMTDEFGKGVGPLRVWVKGGDYPGLAMSRSIGDLKGKTVGIIPDPGIFEYDLNKTTKFIIVCSDGIWEYLTNEKVKDLGKKFYLENNASAFCHTLLSQAFIEWERHDNFVDDITAVVAFF